MPGTGSLRPDGVASLWPCAHRAKNKVSTAIFGHSTFCFQVPRLRHPPQGSPGDRAEVKQTRRKRACLAATPPRLFPPAPVLRGAGRRVRAPPPPPPEHRSRALARQQAHPRGACLLCCCALRWARPRAYSDYTMNGPNILNQSEALVARGVHPHAPRRNVEDHTRLLAPGSHAEAATFSVFAMVTLYYRTTGLMKNSTKAAPRTHPARRRPHLITSCVPPCIWLPCAPFLASAHQAPGTHLSSTAASCRSASRAGPT